MKMTLSLIIALFSFNIWAQSPESTSVPLAQEDFKVIDSYFNTLIDTQYNQSPYYGVFPVDISFETLNVTRNSETKSVDSYKVRLNARNPKDKDLTASPGSEILFLDVGVDFSQANEFEAVFKGEASVETLIGRFVSAEERKEEKQALISEVRESVEEIYENFMAKVHLYPNLEFTPDFMKEDALTGDAYISIHVAPKQGVELQAFKEAELKVQYTNSSWDLITKELIPEKISLDALVNGASDDATTQEIQGFLTKVVNDILNTDVMTNIKKMNEVIFKVVDAAMDDADEQEVKEDAVEETEDFE